jgi:membrane-associated HD superfamily phosphohydrolase
VRFFYDRAVEQSRAPFPATPAPDPAAYRYDGPRPRFRESAIIHLADGVEAAARSLRDVTPEKLAALIARIIGTRMADGQLDEAPLTLAELGQVKESFARTLLSMTHTRIEYPTVPPAAAEAAS